MKLDQTQHNIESSGVLNEALFGISVEDQSHILSILRDKLYSDKVLAVVREYCANAIDAHIEAGKPELPIKVTLPNRLNPHFIVRDYGIGLTEKEVFKLYIQYGKSSKRSSNDVIGQLGLGCKSAFAYTDSFTVTSWNNNTKSTYHAFIDETDMGKMVKLSEELSDEPSGIEIKIAVKNQDYRNFVDRAARLFKYFDVLPDTNISVETITKGLSGTFWWVPKGDRYWLTPMAIMGNIVYPIDWRQIRPHINTNQRVLESAIDLKPVIKFNIGDLAVSASREALEYTDKTIQSISKALATLSTEIKHTLATEIAQTKTALEARRIHTKRSGELDYHLRQLMPNTWRHINLKEGITLQAGESPQFRYMTRHQHNSHDNHMGYWDSNLIIANSSIFINDVSTAWVTRARRLMREHKISYAASYTAHASTRAGALAEVQAFLKRYDLEGMSIYYLSDAQYQAERQAGLGAGKRKSTTTVFKLIEPTDICSWRAMSYDNHKYWEPVEVNLKQDSGTYVTLSRYMSINERHTNRKLLEISKQMRQLGTHPGEIYGIKKQMVEKRVQKLPNWTSLSEHVRQIPQAYYNKYKSRIDFVRAYLELIHDLSWDRWQVKALRSFQMPEDGYDNQLLRLMHFTARYGRRLILQGSKSKSHYHRLDELERIFGVEAIKAQVQPLTTHEEIKKQYPLLQYISLETSSLTDITDYILLVDQEERYNAADATTSNDQDRQHSVCDSQQSDVPYRFKPYELGDSDTGS